MAEQETGNKSDNNMKIAITIIIVLVGFLALAIFALQQDKNDSNTNTVTEGNTTEATQGTSDSPKEDAGAIGENEIEFTDDNFEAEVSDYSGVVLIDFYLSTCPYCQSVAKDVTDAADELVGKAKVGKLDARAHSVTSDKYKIESVPTFIVFKNGEEVERVTGVKSKQELIDMVNKHL